MLYASTALLLVRTVFRTVEYFGYDRAGGLAALPVLWRYEWFFYVFEAVLMLLNSVLWAVFHPRRYLPGSGRVYLERDGVTETEGAGWEDGRARWVTVVDPFGWFGPGKSSCGGHVIEK